MKKIAALLILLAFLLPVNCLASAKAHPANEAGPERTAIVIVPNSEVFAKTSRKSERLSEVLMGDEFKVAREEGEWAYGHIPSQQGYAGWIQKKDISFSLNESPFKGRSFIHVKTTKTQIMFRDGSYVDVYAGTRLPLLKKNNNRYEVITPDGSPGFIAPDSVEEEDDNFGKYVTPEDILKATRFFNSSYKWGGITAGGMDCSGFVYAVFRVNGIYLKRDSYMQAEEGVDVPVDDLREGDLVFFSTRKGGRITHVGIYIGQGNFIHSSRGKKGVAVSSLSEDYFRKRLAAARRVLPPNRSVREKTDKNRAATGEV